MGIAQRRARLTCWALINQIAARKPVVSDTKVRSIARASGSSRRNRTGCRVSLSFSDDTYLQKRHRLPARRDRKSHEVYLYLSGLFGSANNLLVRAGAGCAERVANGNVFGEPSDSHRKAEDSELLEGKKWL